MRVTMNIQTSSGRYMQRYDICIYKIFKYKEIID